MFGKKLNYKLINITALMLLLYIAVSNIEVWLNIFLGALSIFAPFIVAFAFSYATYPLVKFLEKKGIKKQFGIIIVVVTIVLLFISILMITLPLVYDQLVSFSRTLLDVSSDISNRYNLNLGPVSIRIEDYLNEIVVNLSHMISSGTAGFINGFLSFMGRFAVGFIAWIYFLAYMEKIRYALKQFLMSHSKKFYGYLESLDKEFAQYIKGLSIFMIIQFVQYSFLFFIIGHPNWLILGILASVTTIIPYFGGIATNIIAIITATAVSQPVFIGTVVICLIFPQLDGYVISPRIYGKTNKVNPLIVIMAISIGGTIAGIKGIIIALPMYLFLRVTYQYFKQDLKTGVKKLKRSI